MKGDKDCPSPWHRGLARQEYPWRCPLCDLEARRVGMLLPNGYVVLEMTNGVILAVRDGDTKPKEYATWRWDGQSLHSTTYGHYFDLLILAVADYVQRVAEEIEREMAERRPPRVGRPADGISATHPLGHPVEAYDKDKGDDRG